MMDSYSIRLGKTDTVFSLNRENDLDVSITQTSKPVRYLDVKRTVEQYERFVLERSMCNKYRFIVTIVPYCTNVLFNTFTEIVKDECGNNPVRVFDSSTGQNISGNDVLGKKNGVTRRDMILNTEYSRKEIGYTYHPGYDMFDNHIFRNKSFKIVNIPKNKSTHDETFNTIRDFYRTPDGNTVNMYIRKKLSMEPVNVKRHLYAGDDLLDIDESVNANLIEENGWWGFSNPSTIDGRNGRDKTFEVLGISRVDNSRESCEFFDMYPDRTLFSFNPRYNQVKRRLEYNWDIFLTYPYKRVDAVGNGFNLFNEHGLLAATVRVIDGVYGDKVIMVRSLAKHGLSKGDFVLLTAENATKTLQYRFRVVNVGDLAQEQADFYFYVRYNDSFSTAFTDSGLPVDGNDFRFARCVGESQSEYYIRKFRKIPNFKFRKRNLTDSDTGNIDSYIDENCKDAENGMMYPLDKEQYRPAFAGSVYTDETTQVTFTDTVDITGLVDNMGRPLTEVYVTLVKRNKGSDKWYSDDAHDMSDVEFSHCFGPLSCGLKYSQREGEFIDVSARRIQNGDVCMMFRAYDSDNMSTKVFDDDINPEDDDFYGDLVEFNVNECAEKVLQPFMFRFNSAQRELHKHDGNALFDSDFVYAEMMRDDYSCYNSTPFLVKDVKANDTSGGSKLPDYFRPEGYYYQAHYRIPVRGFGESVNQSSHYDVEPVSVSVVQEGDIYIKVKTSVRHGASVGDMVSLFDDKNGLRFDFSVSYSDGSPYFLMHPVGTWDDIRKAIDDAYTDYGTAATRCVWLDVANLVEVGFFKVRLINHDIPSYAVEAGENVYLWRDILGVGEADASVLPEYDYANDAFYVSNNVNFYLKRQDPFGYNGLRRDNVFPNDISGNKKKDSIHTYKTEDDIVC